MSGKAFFADDERAASSMESPRLLIYVFAGIVPGDVSAETDRWLSVIGPRLGRQAFPALQKVSLKLLDKFPVLSS